MKKQDYLFLGAAFMSFLFSNYLWFMGMKMEGLYVGLWVPSILAASVLIKLIKKNN